MPLPRVAILSCSQSYGTPCTGDVHGFKVGLGSIQAVCLEVSRQVTQPELRFRSYCSKQREGRGWRYRSYRTQQGCAVR